MKVFVLPFLLLIVGVVAVAQPCPEPFPLVKAAPCTPGPGLYVQKSVRVFDGYGRLYAPTQAQIHEVTIAIQSGNTVTSQYAVSLTIEKNDGSVATKHMVVERSWSMWSKAYFLC